jgi:hypothetical protein
MVMLEVKADGCCVELPLVVLLIDHIFLSAGCLLHAGQLALEVLVDLHHFPHIDQFLLLLNLLNLVPASIFLFLLLHRFV